MSLTIDTVDTVAYPAWWAGATTVTIGFGTSSSVTVARSDVELLPQGVSVAGSTNALLPWSQVRSVDKAS